jgi:ubiquinone/menaquinone biosynthesis C-methylase UbiE
VSEYIDQVYLKTNQYKDASNLNARIAIHKQFSTNPYGWMNWVFDHLLNLPEDAKILELGCGPAYLWEENISRIPSGWRITLSDFSPGMLDAAWRNLVVTGRTFKFKEIDAQSIPFEDELFDAVVANHMLYHVPDRLKAMEEIHRVLKSGGHLFATTIGQNHLKEIANWIRQVNPRTDFVSFGSPFTLENGFEQLKQFFPQVTLSRYPDRLHVTEVKSIIAFILSTSHAAEIAEEKLAKLERDLEQELKEKGKISIQKDSGLFEAIK